MDELQVVDDILNQLYGYDTIFNSNDTELIQKKKIEKNEKQEELINQINLMCSMLEKELRQEMGEAFFEIKKGLRTFVIDSIQKEIKNGNTVIGSDGKISLKRFSTQLLAHKNEIINEKKSNTINVKEENVAETNLGSKEKTLNDEFVKRKAEGKTDQEVIQEMINEYSAEEIDALMNDMRLAAAYETLKIFSVENERFTGNDIVESELAPISQEPTPEPTPEPLPMSQESIAEPSPMSLKRIPVNGTHGTLTTIKKNNVAIRLVNPRKISDWKEKSMFFEKFYTECRDKDGKGVKKVLYGHKEAGLIDAEAPAFLSAGDKIYGVIQEIANNMDYYNSDRLISEGKREILNGYLDVFSVEQEKERRDLSEAMIKELESRGEEIVVSPIKINVPHPPTDKERIQAETLVYDKNIAEKYELNSSKTLGKRILELDSVKNYTQNNATEWQIRDVTDTLTQVGKEVVSLEENSTENKQQDSNEPQTPESGPGEPDDEVK